MRSNWAGVSGGRSARVLRTYDSMASDVFWRLTGYRPQQ